MSYVLFDIGGTKTRVAVSEDLKSFGDPIKFDTPNSFSDGITEIVKAAKKLTDGKVRGIAGGIRGQLNDSKSELVRDAILTDWVDQPLADTLKKKLGAEVYLENDAAIAGIGEAIFGAGKGLDIVVYHTISTGVGGAKIEQGKIDSSRGGFEPGHQILDIDHTILGEGVEPTLENLVSGAALEARLGVKAYEVDQSDAVWDQLAYYLAHGLRNSIIYWSPDAIVLGGSMILGDPRIPLDAIITHTNAVVDGLTDVPLIKDAALGDFAGLYGAMAVLDQRV